MRGRLVVMLGLTFLLFSTGATATPFLYVTDWYPSGPALDNRVTIVDLQDYAVKGSVTVPSPYGISITPDGTKAYTANWQNTTCSAISISLTSNTLIETMKGVAGHAQHIAITPDGTRAFVATDSGISVIETATNSISNWITTLQGVPYTLPGVSYVTLSPDGNWLFATYDFYNTYGGSIAKIDTATGEIQAYFQYTAQLTSEVVNPDGTRLYVSSQSDNRIYIFSTATLERVDYVEAAHGLRMLLSKDGTRLYVTNNIWTPLEGDPVPLNLLQIINTGANSVIKEIPITKPVGLALTPDEGRLLVSCASGVAVVDLATQEIVYLGGFTQPKEIAVYGAVETPVLQVAIDIKPGSSVNQIKLKDEGKVPVAILGDPAFDVTTVDRGTVEFAGAPPLSIGGLPEDLNGDGLLDLVLHFATQDLRLQPGDTQACLSGKTWSDQAFKGCDIVRVIELKAKKAYKQGKK